MLNLIMFKVHQGHNEIFVAKIEVYYGSFNKSEYQITERKQKLIKFSLYDIIIIK